jgi:hypothetical protein
MFIPDRWPNAFRQPTYRIVIGRIASRSRKNHNLLIVARRFIKISKVSRIDSIGCYLKMHIRLFTRRLKFIEAMSVFVRAAGYKPSVGHHASFHRFYVGRFLLTP